MANYEFHYANDGYDLLEWIHTKIQKIYSVNRTKVGSKFKALEGLEAREFDLHPRQIGLYSRDVEASVYFRLDQTTGDIKVFYVSESYGKKGGNPWWCIAESRPDSSVCGEGSNKISMLPADDPHSPSIVEYLLANVRRRIPGAANVAPAGGARKSRKQRKQTRKQTRKNRA
jgi:hypothetical protein